jgi:hypothetical protein
MTLGYRVAIVTLLLPFAACSKEKLGEFADKAKQAVVEGTEKVKEQAGAVADTAKEQLALAGSCEITLDSPVATSGCYFTFLPQGSGRPSVLQIRSYRDPAQESFPSVLLQLQVQAGGLTELVGQTRPAQLFVQKAHDTPVWFCPTGGSVDLKIVSLDDKLLHVEIVGGSLRNSETGTDQTVTGKLSGVPQ